MAHNNRSKKKKKKKKHGKPSIIHNHHNAISITLQFRSTWIGLRRLPFMFHRFGHYILYRFFYLIWFDFLHCIVLCHWQYLFIYFNFIFIFYCLMYICLSLIFTFGNNRFNTNWENLKTSPIEHQITSLTTHPREWLNQHGKNVIRRGNERDLNNNAPKTILIRRRNKKKKDAEVNQEAKKRKQQWQREREKQKGTIQYTLCAI